MKLFRIIAASLALIMGLTSLPAAAQGPSGNPDYSDTETPPAYAMVGDLVVARPLLVAATIVGTGIFVITLPFTIASGSVGEAGRALMLAPGESAFVRCLGCTKSGYAAEQ